MLAEERFSAIISKVEARRTVTVAELARELDTSESTIRRDLNYLDECGKLNKVRGGATARDHEFSSIENDMITKETLNVDEKRVIAAYAASLIYDDDFVYIDAGTTTLYMCEALTNTRATYVTNGVLHAGVLASKGCRVYLPGGLLKGTTSALIGAEAAGSLSSYNFTKAFLGTNGITSRQGMTTPDPDEAQIKRKAVEQSFMAYALADHTKFGKVYAVKIAPLERMCIITDHLPNRDYAQKTVIKEVGGKETG